MLTGEQVDHGLKRYAEQIAEAFKAAGAPSAVVVIAVPTGTQRFNTVRWATTMPQEKLRELVEVLGEQWALERLVVMPAAGKH